MSAAQQDGGPREIRQPTMERGREREEGWREGRGGMEGEGEWKEKKDGGRGEGAEGGRGKRGKSNIRKGGQGGEREDKEEEGRERVGRNRERERRERARRERRDGGKEGGGVKMVRARTHLLFQCPSITVVLRMASGRTVRNKRQTTLAVHLCS